MLLKKIAQGVFLQSNNLLKKFSKGAPRLRKEPALKLLKLS